MKKFITLCVAAAVLVAFRDARHGDDGRAFGKTVGNDHGLQVHGFVPGV